MADDEVMVDTVAGKSTTQEFRMAVTPGRVHVQDLVAVDAQLEEVDGKSTAIRIWAKLEAIERINPLFPRESGQELADLQVNPIDTVISLSRAMITALCRVLGYEEKGDDSISIEAKLSSPGSACNARRWLASSASFPEGEARERSDPARDRGRVTGACYLSPVSA